MCSLDHPEIHELLSIIPGFPLLLTLSPAPGVPSVPSISKAQNQAALTDSPHLPARRSRHSPWSVPLTEYVAHARLLAIQRQNWPFSGLWAP